MAEVGYSDSDTEVPSIGRRVRFNNKFLNEVDALESPRFGFNRGRSQDSFTTQCSTPRLNDKYPHLFNYNQKPHWGLASDQINYADPFDKIMSQTLQLEQLSNLPEVYVSDKQQWDGFINTLPPSPVTTPKNTNEKGGTGGTENMAMLNPSDYPLFTSAINRNWDNLLNYTQGGVVKDTNTRLQDTTARQNTQDNFKWWCDDQQVGLQQNATANPNRSDKPEIGVNTEITSTDLDNGGNRLKMMTKLNEQYQDRIQQIISKEDTDLIKGEGKEFIIAVRDHMLKVHRQMQVLMTENLKLRNKIEKSKTIFGPLYDTITVLRQDTGALIMENNNLMKELKIARQDKAYAVEYCKSSNEALKQTSMEKDKIISEFNNIANSKVVLEREFKETINNMQNMKAKLIEWQSKVNGVPPVKKTVRFSEQSDLHFVSQSQPPAATLQPATPTICKSVQEQIQTYQNNCNK